MSIKSVLQIAVIAVVAVAVAKRIPVVNTFLA